MLLVTIPLLPQSFDVASVKPQAGPCGTTFGAGQGKAGGQCVTLQRIMAFAWRIQEFQITGGPSWVGSDLFDIEGKTSDPNATPDQLRLMLRSLLRDRFALAVRNGQKESVVYALVVGKNGPKIKPSADQSDDVVNGPAPPGAGPNHGAIRFGHGSLTGNAVKLDLFAKMLSEQVDRVVLDRTGLTGRFDLQLRWTPAREDSDNSGPSVFTAIQEQMGLKLESAKAPIDVLVIDHVARPSAN